MPTSYLEQYFVARLCWRRSWVYQRDNFRTRLVLVALCTLGLDTPRLEQRKTQDYLRKKQFAISRL